MAQHRILTSVGKAIIYYLSCSGGANCQKKQMIYFKGPCAYLVWLSYLLSAFLNLCTLQLILRPVQYISVSRR